MSDENIAKTKQIIDRCAQDGVDKPAARIVVHGTT